MLFFCLIFDRRHLVAILSNIGTKIDLFSFDISCFLVDNLKTRGEPEVEIFSTLTGYSENLFLLPLKELE